MWSYAFDGDPYDVVIKIPERAKQVGRQQYARSPGSDVWVWFDDLPKTIERALWKKHGAKLMFPARLPSWPAPGSEDTELGVLLEPEVGHGEAEVYARVQA
jgi:hypothetical protein